MGGYLAQVGYGYWGHNQARNLNTLAGQSWRYLVEPVAQRRAPAAALYPPLRATGSPGGMLADPGVVAGGVGTPAAPHAPPARPGLGGGQGRVVGAPGARRDA